MYGDNSQSHLDCGGFFHSPLVFLHIPKTAGTTLWLILRRQYTPEAVLRMDHMADLAAMAPEQKARARVLLGHFEYGAGDFLPKPPQYVTVLRDPLERVLSSYSHMVRAAQSAAQDNHRAARFSQVQTLKDYVASGFGEIDNRMTRMLAGPAARALPFGQCNRDVFELAKKNLADGVAVVGLTERFDEMLVILQRRFGWNIPLYVKENVGANRVQREDVPRDVLKRIWELTVWDRALYALAAERFERQIAAEGAGFADAVRRFRWANVRYRRMKALVHSGPLQVVKSRFSISRQMGMETAVRSAIWGVTRVFGVSESSAADLSR